MIEAPISLTLDQIKQQFPPQMEKFEIDPHTKKGEPVEAMVSRDQAGKIVFVVPGSIKKLEFTPDKFPVRRFRPATFDCAIPPISPDAPPSK